MAWTNADKRTFRKELAKVFATEARVRMVLEHANVDLARVTFGVPVEDMWFSGISEAERAGKLDAALDAAIAEAPDNKVLAQVRDRVRGSVQQTGAQPPAAPRTPVAAHTNSTPFVTYVLPSTPGEGIDWDEMKGPQFGRLSDAIQDAFPTPDALRIFMERSLGRNLFALTGSGPLPTMLLDVLTTARAQGWLHELYAAAVAANPGNKKLVAFAKDTRVRLATQDEQGHVRFESATSASLQSVVPGAPPFQDMEAMVRNASKIRAQVCRIEIGGRPAGTGFLIGPSAVLTNWHVIHDPNGTPCDGASVVLRFDYLRAGDMIVHHGTEFRLEHDWLIDALPPSPAELMGDPNGAPSTIDQLDYAVLCVADEPGNSKVGGEKATPETPKRAWVRVPAGTPALSLGSPLVVVQHPLAEPLSIASSTHAIVEVTAKRTRVRYVVHTERGSSGSPCFDKDWSLVALHHSGQMSMNPLWNEGIPIDTIRERLIARNIWGGIGN